MSESATAKVWQLDVERVVGALRDAGPDEQRLALDRLGKRYGVEARVTAAARLAPKPPPEPGPAAKPEPEPETTPEPKVEARPAEGPPVLNPNAPYAIAGEYIHWHCMIGDACVLWHWQGQFYR